MQQRELVLSQPTVDLSPQLIGSDVTSNAFLSFSLFLLLFSLVLKSSVTNETRPVVLKTPDLQ